MYKKFYLMQKEPFDTHPSPELFYKSTAHQNAWNFLLNGIKNNEPIALVAGEYGSGKTLLCLKLMKLLEKNTNLNSVCVPTPTYTFIMVLEKILVELDIPIDGIDPSDESRLQQAIYEHFEKKTSKKKKFIYVVVDDGQEFSYSFIYKLRLFACYNFSGYFPIRIIIFSHPCFLKMLNHEKIVAFGQRIKRIYFLKPLGFEETREYIYFRLIHSGATGKPIFDNEAIQFIQTISKGIPRLINNICDNCLLVACSKRCELINQPLVEQALAIGNLTGLEKAQRPHDSSIFSPDTTDNAVKKPVLPENNVYENEHADPEDDDNYSQKNRIDLQNIGSRYGKISIIIILVLIMLFLFFYLFNQSKANQMYKLQSSSERIIKTDPDLLYIVENYDMDKKSKKNNLNINVVAKKNKLAIEKKYRPIILMGNLM